MKKKLGPNPYAADDAPMLAQEALAELGVVSEANAARVPTPSGPGVTFRPMSKWFDGGTPTPYGTDGRREPWDDSATRRRNEKLRIVDEIFEHNGEVSFVIDMFVSFVCQGIDIHHTSTSKQDRYRHWWNKVGGKHVSERLVSEFLRHGFGAVEVAYGDLKKKDVADLDATEAARPAPDLAYVRSQPSPRGRIPLLYEIQSPYDVEMIGGELNRVSRRKRYGIRMSETLRSMIRSPNESNRDLIKDLPKTWIDAAESKDPVVPMDADHLVVLHYKKDDYKPWADPLIYSIVEDLHIYRCMKAADLAALEGSISRLRLIKLGMIWDQHNKILPSRDDIQSLRNQLLAIRNGASSDLIWHPAISIEETGSDVANFLGPDKYRQIISAIYAGLGIPQTLAGASSEGGMTNNALSLKTLMERLSYARDLLVKFWRGEFEKLRRAFGDRYAAELKFDLMSLADEAAEKKLWIDLYDRHVISEETLLGRFGQLPRVENARIRREDAQRAAGTRPARLGVFTENETHPDQMKKALLNQGHFAPSEVGVEVKPRKKGEKSLLDRQEELAAKAAAAKPTPDSGSGKKGVAGEGRPKGRTDETKRKRRTPKVRQAAAGLVALQAKAREDLRAIDRALTPAFLAAAGKKNLRQLTSAEASALEDAKFAALMAVPPDARATAEWAASGEAPSTPLLPHSELLNSLIADAFTSRGVNPTMDDVREMQASAYALFHTEDPTDGDPDPDGRHEG